MRQRYLIPPKLARAVVNVSEPIQIPADENAPFEPGALNRREDAIARGFACSEMIEHEHLWVRGRCKASQLHVARMEFPEVL
jgi:elongation factor P hydroxylase